MLRNFRQQNYPSVAGISRRAGKIRTHGGRSEAPSAVAGGGAALHGAALPHGDVRRRLRNRPIAWRIGRRTAHDRRSEEDEMDAWLKQARGGTRIQFKKEAFQ